MQLVRTAQPKHKINLLSLSTEAGGPDVGHLVCSINSMQFVRTAQFKHKHLLALYSHSPRRTGGPQAPASGALVLCTNNNTSNFFVRIRELEFLVMYGHTYNKSMDQPGKVASPARGQLNRKKEYFPAPVCKHLNPNVLSIHPVSQSGGQNVKMFRWEHRL